MTAKTFKEVLRVWNVRLIQKGHRVLLCLNNFCGHLLTSSWTTSNRSSHLTQQPILNQGIIENLKCHYEKILLCCPLKVLDIGKGFEFTLFDALRVVRHTWEQVSELMIRNCFAKAKFTEVEYQPVPDDAELLEIWEALPVKEKMHENEEIELTFLKLMSASCLEGFSHWRRLQRKCCTAKS